MSRWPTLLAFALIAAAVITFRPVQTPGPFLRDFEAYWSAGSAWNARSDPYGRTIWQAESGVPGVDGSRDELLPFVGPPATLLAWSVLARFPYLVAARLWFTVLAMSALALAAVVVRASSASASLASLVSAAALAIAFGPVTSDVALGQVALMAYVAAAIVALPLGLAPRAIAAFVALFQPNVALALISQLGRKRATLAIALGGLATYACGAMFSGWLWPADYALRLLPHESAERLSAIQLTPAAIAYGVGIPVGATAFVALASAIVAVTTACLMWRHIADPFARFAAIAPLAPLVSTFFHEHDLVVAYAAAGWCALRARGAARALGLGATLLVAIDWLGLAQRPTGIFQSVLLAAAAACAFTALGERADWRATAAAVVPLAVIFIFAAWLAAGNPAPVWPDALGNFHAVPGASVADLWRDEQARTGLLRANPVWALLRGLSLTGCALLSLSVFATQRSDEVSNSPSS